MPFFERMPESPKDQRPGGRKTHAIPDTIPDVIRNELIMFIGEFCGTFMFLFMSFIGAQTAINNNDDDPNAKLHPFSLLFIASSFGSALAVNVWIFFRVTGGLFNPAVS